jgi:hypothetical protein
MLPKCICEVATTSVVRAFMLFERERGGGGGGEDLATRVWRSGLNSASPVVTGEAR